MSYFECVYHNTDDGRVLFLIPKKRGKGFLKAPFGGHHCNDYYFAFKNLCDYDCVDIDGYLEVLVPERVKKSPYTLPLLLFNILEVFPGIMFFNEVSYSDFIDRWKGVKIKNNYPLCCYGAEYIREICKGEK